MSPEQTRFIILLFGGVLVFSVLVLTWAVRVRKRRSAAYRAGLGSPDVPPATQPWERFSLALAAPYSRRDWHVTRGARRQHTEDQVYFGYASALIIPQVRSNLAQDWSVKNEQSAHGVVGDAVAGVLQQAGAALGGLGQTPDSVLGALRHAGAPVPEAELLSAHVVPGEMASEDDLAFDIARSAHLVRGAAAAGYLSADQARSAMEVFGVSAATVFGSWDAYGQAYLRGLNAFTKRGNKPFVQAVSWLTTETDSPWASQPWPRLS